MIRSSLRHAAPVIALALASFAGMGCSKDSSGSSAGSAGSASAAAVAPKPSASAATTAPAKATAAALAKPAAAPPVKLSLPVEKQQPVPKEWIELKDESKGFDFSVPAGTTGAQKTVNGTLVYMADMPPPAKIGLLVVASPKPIKDLIDDVDDIIAKVLDEKNVKVVGTQSAIADGFMLIEFTSQDTTSGTPDHWKCLLATNAPNSSYVLIVGSPESEFKADLPTIDEIWGSFDMIKPAAAGDAPADPGAAPADHDSPQ